MVLQLDDGMWIFRFYAITLILLYRHFTESKEKLLSTDILWKTASTPKTEEKSKDWGSSLSSYRLTLGNLSN